MGEGYKKGEKNTPQREREFMLSLANSFAPCHCLKAGFKMIIELVYSSKGRGCLGEGWGVVQQWV